MRFGGEGRGGRRTVFIGSREEWGLWDRISAFYCTLVMNYYKKEKIYEKRAIKYTLGFFY